MAFQAENLKGLAALTALLADMLEDHFFEESAVTEQGSEARPGEQHLSLVPERALRAVVPPQPEEPTDPGLPESAAGDGTDAANGDDFVGTRTGTHRRRGMAQSA